MPENSASRGRSLRDLLLVVSAKLVSVGALFFMGVLAARVTDPVTYGHYATALGLLLLIDALAGGPMDTATMRFSTLHREEPERVARIQSAMFRLKLLLGVGLMALTLPLAGFLGNLVFGEGAHGALLLTTLLGATALLLYRGAAVWLQVEQRFLAYSFMDLGVAGLRVLGALVLAGVAAAAWPWLGLYGFSAFAVFLVTLAWCRPAWLRAPWPSAGEMRQLGGYLGITSLIIALGSFTSRSDIVFLSVFGEAGETGYYGIALQLAMAGTLLASYVAILTQPRILPLARSGRLGGLLKLNLLAGLALLPPVIGAIYWLVPWLVEALYGARYTPAVPLLQILAIGTFLDLLFMPVLLPYGQQLQPRQTLAAEAGVTCCYLIGLWPASHWGALGMAWLVTAVRALKLIAYLGILRRTLALTAGEGAPGPADRRPASGVRSVPR